MPIDIDRLKRFAIPSVRQSLTREQAALYALSLGLGQNPCDEADLRFVDFSRGLRALPAMATVLAHPGFWLAHPDSGVDAARVVHAGHALSLHAELPVEGDIVSQTRLVNVIDKGPGKAALLELCKSLTDAGSGRCLATSTSHIMVREGGGFGGATAAPPPESDVPQGSPDHVISLQTRPEQALLYRLNGDANPLHSDPAVARQAGFARPILHGLCTFGMICHAVVRRCADGDASALQALQLRFLAPVYPGETVCLHIWNSGAFEAWCADRSVRVIGQGRFLFHGCII